MTIGKLSYQFCRSLLLNDRDKKEGRVLTMTLPFCELVNPLRVFTSPCLVLLTHFNIRLPQNLLSLAHEIMGLTLKVHGLSL
jgi:hypothetical protein